jgi:hypothetical protein
MKKDPVRPEIREAIANGAEFHEDPLAGYLVLYKDNVDIRPVVIRINAGEDVSRSEKWREHHLLRDEWNQLRTEGTISQKSTLTYESPMWHDTHNRIYVYRK